MLGSLAFLAGNQPTILHV